MPESIPIKRPTFFSRYRKNICGNDAKISEFLHLYSGILRKSFKKSIKQYLYYKSNRKNLCIGKLIEIDQSLKNGQNRKKPVGLPLSIRDFWTLFLDCYSEKTSKNALF